VNLRPQFTGLLRFATDHTVGRHSLLVMIPCQVGDLRAPVQALFDPGSEWCVLAWEVADALGYQPEPGLTSTAILTRFGTISGNLERVSLRFPAVEGISLEIEATCFVSPDWPGPTVLGWRGCLQRMRFAVDPNDNWFLFAEL
jgi:hypothetical protein